MNTLMHIDQLNIDNRSIFGFMDAVIDNELKHYASDLFPELDMSDEEAFNTSLHRAKQVCITMKLPIDKHFKKIYRTSNNRVYCDYKLSHTAYLLVGINGDVRHEKVAQIQMELVKLLLNH
jgi:antitoxin component of RelBE/YafQ-DinJ toxin-antitoxin module